MNILDLSKYGFNAISNMLIFATYISNGGGTIITYDNNKPLMYFYDSDGNAKILGENLLLGDEIKLPDINTSLMIVYDWLESTHIQRLMFYIEDALVCLSNIDVSQKKLYTKEKTIEKVSYDKPYIEIDIEDFKKKITNVKNNNVMIHPEDFLMFFDFNNNTPVVKEASRNVKRYMNNIGESLDVPL